MRAVQYRYLNPRKAEWPKADYIVGNPPFIGASTMRRALGDGYVDAVRATWTEVPESADFVMHWWHIAAETVRAGSAEQFGFITTNSIKQTFNRRVVQAHMASKNPLSLAFAIPDHPWVDSADGAAVRIAMTVGRAETKVGRLLRVRDESSGKQDEIEVKFQELQGQIFADLQAGANVADAQAIKANENLTSRGMMLFGAGFIISPNEAKRLGLGAISELEKIIRPYRNGRDLAQTPRDVMVIDLLGLEIIEVRSRFPAIYQHLLEHVKPERDQNKDKAIRENWWLHGRTRPELRKYLAGLQSYIATVETTKHRVFQFLDASIIPDNMLVAFGLSDAISLGILSSRLHAAWALSAGGRLGVGNDPRYNKSRCFETFPFPDLHMADKIGEPLSCAVGNQKGVVGETKIAGEHCSERIRHLAEQLDAHRKRQQAEHPALTLTGMYNVLEKIRAGEPLNAKEKTIHEQGLVSVLRELHDELDRAAFEAYGWSDPADKLVGLPGATTPLRDKPEAQAQAEEELLQRLVTLNAARAAEEANGLIRWLRPDYQNPDANAAPQQAEAELTPVAEVATTNKATAKLTWPKQMREQVAAVRQALAQGPRPVEAVAAQFKRSPTTAVQSVLEALEELGMVKQENRQYRLAN